MRKTTRRRGRAGSSPRRSSLTAGAGACAVLIRAGRPPASAGPRGAAPLIPIPKTTQRRSQAGSSPIRSSPTAGAAAWAAFPLAAPDRRPLGRHQQSSQLLLLPAAPLPRSRGRSGAGRLANVYGRSSAQGVRLLPIWWVWQRTAQATQGHRVLLTLTTEVSEVQNRVVRSRAVVYRRWMTGCRLLLREPAAAAECQRHTRSSTSAV